MDNRAIAMFDSGVGGLTVYKEIQKILPHEQIIYLGDTKNFPYGSKSKENIIELSKNNVEFLQKFDVKIIVVACGTATSQALEEIKNIYSVPMVGIIEPTVNYIKEKGYKKIGVMATRGTIKSRAWELELNKHIEGAKVFNVECPLLAPMAEEGWTDNEIARLTVKEYLKKLPEVDAIILGCTHYPMFTNLIKQGVESAEIINTGEIIAKSIKNSIELAEEKQAKNKIYLTDTECNFINVANNILGDNVSFEKC